jgi:hypothetical protein
MRITRYQTEAGLSTELYGLDAKTGIFDFSKVFTPEDGSGVRIQITTPRVGFLGTRAHWSNDLAVLFTYALLFGALFALSERYLGRARDPKLRQRVIEWIGDAKSILGGLGTQIREVIQESQSLTKAGQSSRKSLESLRERVHGGIEGAREGRMIFHELEHSILLSEILVLNLMLSAEKNGAPVVVTATAEELHRTIQRIKSVNTGSARALSDLERKLEPIATDADLAVQSQEELLRVVRKMDGQIRRTTETMVVQARQIQEFNSELSASERKR